MTLQEIEPELRRAIVLKEKREDRVTVFAKTSALCDRKTRRDLKQYEVSDDKSGLMMISKPFDLIGVLDLYPANDRRLCPYWHVTPIFSRRLAKRRHYGNDRQWQVEHRLFKVSNEPIEDYWAEVREFTASNPPLVPANVVEIAKQIESRRKIFDRTAECVPLLLYKPEDWKNREIDPALVAMIGGLWRVFAIWGSIIEQAELLLFGH